jgi:hypothetical protein
MMDAQKEWPSILEFGTGDSITVRLVEQRYRQLAKKYHPDAGGSDEDMQQLNLAKQLALKWIETERERQEQAKRVVSSTAYAQQAMNQFNQANIYQQQQVAGWAAHMAGQAAAWNAVADVLQAKREAQKKPEPTPTWWERMKQKVSGK